MLLEYLSVSVVYFTLTLILFHSQEEESSSSSSEEEEGDQQQNEGLYGKVVCVDGVVTSDKKKTTWYPALVSLDRRTQPIKVKKKKHQNLEFYNTFNKHAY